MAVDDDDNEVNGNDATGDDDGYIGYYNIVKLITLLICLHYNGLARCRRTFEGVRSILLLRAVVAASR